MSGYTDLAGLVKFRPLSVPIDAEETRRSPFSAPFSRTVRDLALEIKSLEPREAVLELDIRESDFRLDGTPRANAVQQSPGVALVLIGTQHGDLRYPASAFHTWQDNVRALALGLNALRRVDSYGITKRGEQYAGWKQLGSGGPSVERGRNLVAQHGTVRAALFAAHPDQGGSSADFADVQAYRETLRA